MDFLKVCKCGRLYVNFLSATVYHSAIMEFWPLQLEQRIKLFLNTMLILKHFYVRAKKACMTQQNNMQKMTAKLKSYSVYLCLVSLIYEAQVVTHCDMFK